MAPPLTIGEAIFLLPERSLPNVPAVGLAQACPQSPSPTTTKTWPPLQAGDAYKLADESTSQAAIACRGIQAHQCT